VIKILHTADIHLDSPLKTLALRDKDLRAQVQAATRAAFRRLIDIALDEAVAALLIAGDLFDGAIRSAKTAAFLITQLDRLKEAGIPVFYIKGNHDAENPVTGAVELPDNVHVFDGRGGKVHLAPHDIWVHGVSFAQKHAPDSLLGKFPTPVPGAVNIGMLHTSLSGAAGHDPYAPCSVAELRAMGFDYWALGHVHKRMVHAETPWIVMPGMPQGRDIGEDGPKSATLIIVEAGQITLREVPTADVIFQRQDIHVTGLDSEDALRALLRRHFSDLAASTAAGAMILRLTLAGQTSLAWSLLRDQDIWRDIVQTLARDAGPIWIEKLKLDVTDDAQTAGSAAATVELAQMMQAIAAELGFAAWRDAELEAVLSDLPRDRRLALAPDAETAKTLGQSLAAAGAAQLLARMKGADG